MSNSFISGVMFKSTFVKVLHNLKVTEWNKTFSWSWSLKGMVITEVE